jgi:hypothetical protein
MLWVDIVDELYPFDTWVQIKEVEKIMLDEEITEVVLYHGSKSCEELKRVGMFVK